MLNSFKRNSPNGTSNRVSKSYKLGNDLSKQVYICIKIIKLLKINNRLKLNEFLLHYALEKKQPKEIIKLLIANENLNIKDNCDYTPLHYALICEHPDEIIKLLITNENLNIQDCNANTPLHIALYNEYPKEIIKLLITEKNKNIKDIYGNTLLQIALKKKYPDEIIKLLN